MQSRESKQTKGQESGSDNIVELCKQIARKRNELQGNKIGEIITMSGMKEQELFGKLDHMYGFELGDNVTYLVLAIPHSHDAKHGEGILEGMTKGFAVVTV